MSVQKIGFIVPFLYAKNHKQERFKPENRKVLNPVSHFNAFL